MILISNDITFGFYINIGVCGLTSDITAEEAAHTQTQNVAPMLCGLGKVRTMACSVS